MDQGLTGKETARKFGIDEESLRNWEQARTRIGVRYYPSIIRFLAYNPLPEPRTLGQAVRQARMARGISRKRLAGLADVDEATVRRLELGTPRMAWRAIRAICHVLDLDAWIPITKSR